MRVRPPFAFAAAALIATSAQAEPMPGSRAEQVEYTHAYAKCKVRGNHKRAHDLVLSNLSDAQMERKFDDLYSSRAIAVLVGCRDLSIRPGVAFRLQPEMLRGALAQELIRLDLRKGPIADLSNRPALSHRQPESQETYKNRLATAKFARQRLKIEQERDNEIAAAWLSIYGECVVRQQPAGAWAWIMSSPESKDEAAAMATVKPALAECLTEGRALNFAKDVLRASLATNYYRLAMSKPAAMTGVTS